MDLQNQIVEPPLYFANDHIFNINFHPKNNILTASLITGEVKLLSYTSEDVKEMANLTHHEESCRQSKFDDDGNIMASVSKDKSYAIVDQNGKVQIHVKNAHEESINTEYFLNGETLATGDDGGAIKIWDLRNPKKSIFDVHEQDETISDFVSTDNNHYLLSTSLDGTLAVYDLRKSNDSDAKLYALSDGMEEDLLSVELIKNGRFVACSTSEGAILLFKWDYFGDFKDRIIGHPNSVDSILKYDEDTLISGSEDGFARAVSVYPNDIIGVLGQHEEDEQFPIQKLSMSHCKNILASCSHDSSIKFYDISYIPQLRQKQQNAQMGGYVSDSDDEMLKEDEDKDKQLKEKDPEKFKKRQEKRKQHALMKMKQLEDEFSDDDQWDDEEDQMDMDDDSDDDDDDEEDMMDSDENQQQKKKGKQSKRVMAKGKKTVKQRQGEIQKEKRAQFFDNM